jgi:hypothetical protein
VAVLFAATQSGSIVVGVLCVYTIIQSIEAYLILPMIMRGAVRVHPAVTLFTVVLWGKIFGVPGLMLAIPINLTIGTAVQQFYVRPRDERLSRPAVPSLPAASASAPANPQSGSSAAGEDRSAHLISQTSADQCSST